MKATRLNPLLFCKHAESCISSTMHISKPIYHGGWMYMTDGHVAVRVRSRHAAIKVDAPADRLPQNLPWWGWCQYGIVKLDRPTTVIDRHGTHRQTLGPISVRKRTRDALASLKNVRWCYAEQVGGTGSAVLAFNFNGGEGLVMGELIRS